MADHDDVRRIALSLPDTVEEEDRFGFSVVVKGKHKGIVWTWYERIDPKKPRVARPDVLVVRVADPVERETLFASDPDRFFTEPHWSGYPAVLIRLAAVEPDELAELITEAWRSVAPRALVRAFDAGRAEA
jgi:hypothetical protein